MIRQIPKLTVRQISMPPAGTSGSEMEGDNSLRVPWLLKLEPVHPSPSAQAKPSGPGPEGQDRSSSRALHLDPRRLARSPEGGPTVTG